jgi:hypothetical protein
MSNADDPLDKQWQASPRPQPRADLAAQIIRHATLREQHLDWQQRCLRALGEFSYAWQYKLASLALCGVLGVFAGQWQDTTDNTELLISAQMLDSALYTEDL